MGYLPGMFRIWFYHDCALPTISLDLLLCPWIWSIFFFFFLMGSSVFLSMVEQLVAILLLWWEKMNAHPSTLPSWTSLSNELFWHPFWKSVYYKVISLYTLHFVLFIFISVPNCLDLLWLCSKLASPNICSLLKNVLTILALCISMLILGLS